MEEKDEDVVERLAREFLKGMEDEEVKSQEPRAKSQEPEDKDSRLDIPRELSKEELSYPSDFEGQLPEEPYSSIEVKSQEEEIRSQLKGQLPEEPYSSTFETPSSEEEPSLPTFETELPEEVSSQQEEISRQLYEEEKPSLPTFEVPLPEKKPSPLIFEEPVEEPAMPAPTYSPILEEEKEVKPERPSDEKIEEILAKLEEEERGVGLSKEPVKEEEEEEEFAEIEEVSDEEILVKHPKSRKANLKFIKFAILGCIFGGIIIAGAFYLASRYFVSGKSYYKPITNLINLDVINNTVNKIFRPSCDLMVSSNPPACDLFVDDIVKGKTPITIKKLMSGDHNIKIEKEGFKPWISVVSVVSRKPIDIIANLEPEIKIPDVIPVVVGTSTLIIRTNPAGAAVYIDGKRVKMPHTILSGTHSIRVFNDGFFKWTKVIEIKQGETKEVFIQLAPCSGSIFIDSNPREGYVLFNGDIKGKTPIILSGISPWKPFRITIRREGCFDWNGTTFVEPNQRTKIMASLKESGVKSQESRVGSRESGVGSRESGVRSQESRVGSRESGVGSQEEARFVSRESFYETRKESGGFVPSVPTRKEDKTVETSASILELKRAIDMFKEQVKVEVPAIPPFPEEPFLKQDMPKIIKEKLKPQITGGTGYCFITSVPAGAEVFLNGRLIGKTPIREFTISAGKHRLKACLSGFKEEEKEILVSSETTNFFNFSLSSK